MKLTPQASDPPVIRYAKWGTVILVFMGTLFAAGVATIKTGVQWASEPLVRAESRSRAVADSLIVSRLEAMDRKQDQLAIALSFPEGPQRDMMLKRVLGIEPRQVILPENAQGSSSDKPE